VIPIDFNWFLEYYDWVFWAGLPALMLHQFEEFIYPGGFRHWLNQTVLGSDDANFPMTRKLAFVMNVPVMWSLMIATAIVGSDHLWFSLGVMSILFVNAWFHLVMSLVTDKYVPGTYTSLAIILPLTVYTYSFFLTTWQVSFQLVFYCILFGIVVHMAILSVPRGWKRAAIKPDD